MALVKTDNVNYYYIADAIRQKNGQARAYTPKQMPAAILAMSVGESAGTQLYSGDITLSSGHELLDITGIPFEPKGVMLCKYSGSSRGDLGFLWQYPDECYTGWGWDFDSITSYDDLPADPGSGLFAIDGDGVVWTVSLAAVASIQCDWTAGSYKYLIWG